MADRLKTLLEEELTNLVVQRDGLRAQAIKFTDAAGKIDKQVNRLQHFLADYSDVEYDTPEAINGKKPFKRRRGLKEAVSSLLQSYYPEYLTDKYIREEIKSQGLNPSSITTALTRGTQMGRYECSKDKKTGKNTYRHIIPNHTVDK